MQHPVCGGATRRTQRAVPWVCRWTLRVSARLAFPVFKPQTVAAGRQAGEHRPGDDSYYPFTVHRRSWRTQQTELINSLVWPTDVRLQRLVKLTGSAKQRCHSTRRGGGGRPPLTSLDTFHQTADRPLNKSRPVIYCLFGSRILQLNVREEQVWGLED